MSRTGNDGQALVPNEADEERIGTCDDKRGFKKGEVPSSATTDQTASVISSPDVDGCGSDDTFTGSLRHHGT